MYTNEEGKADQIRKERFSLIAMLLSTMLLFAFIYGTLNYGGFNKVYLVIYIVWFALSVKFTRVYLFFTPRRKCGTVKEIKDFVETHYTANGGAGILYGRHSAPITECLLVVDHDNGKVGEYRFVFKGDFKILKAGDRVGIYRFLKMPVWEQ